MTIEFRHGAFCDNYEKQAIQQGYTLGKKAEFLQSLGDSIVSLKIERLLTDSQCDAAYRKLEKKIKRSLRPLRGD